jgi:hypothetical protein
VTTKRRSGSSSKYFYFFSPDGTCYKSVNQVHKALTATAAEGERQEEPEAQGEPDAQEEPDDDDDTPSVIWEIDEIVDMRTRDGVKEYKVKWTSTWVKEPDLGECTEALEEYERRNA